MTDKPPAKPPVIVIARPLRNRPRPVQAAVASPVRIVYVPRQKQKDAGRGFLALTGRDE
jgi:hypothetical protein